jgi:hypothetical protein
MPEYMDHDKGRVFLLEVSEILDNLGIPYFLLQGTALGAYRDRGFTPTERDIDLGILIEHFKAGEICKALIEANYAVETRDRHSPFSFAHTIVVYKDGIKADLVGLHLWNGFRFTNTPDNPTEILEPYCIVHTHSLLEKYQPVTVFGKHFWVPSPIEDYLRLEYGPDWRTPKEDHESRTRIYGFLNQIPREFFNARPF